MMTMRVANLKHGVVVKKKFKKGSMIFFPSWVLHKVNPVTKGTRYSLVVWFLGAPFR